jgi:uncharacterized membrane protein
LRFSLILLSTKYYLRSIVSYTFEASFVDICPRVFNVIIIIRLFRLSDRPSVQLGRLTTVLLSRTRLGLLSRPNPGLTISATKLKARKEIPLMVGMTAFKVPPLFLLSVIFLSCILWNRMFIAMFTRDRHWSAS